MQLSFVIIALFKEIIYNYNPCVSFTARDGFLLDIGKNVCM